MLELWCSGLTCLPVTQEIAGSTPVSSAIFAAVAQSVEQWTENPRVGSSILPCGTIICGRSSVVEHRLAMARVAGSNPVFRSIRGGIAKR